MNEQNPTDLVPVTSGPIEYWSGAAKTGLKNRREREKIVADVLKSGPDFGIIPGTSKPTLLKPGAEKIADSLNLWPDFTILKEREEFGLEAEDPFFFYKYRCILRQRGSDLAVGSGNGSCNSMEKRYRYYSGGSLRPPEDIFAQVNTIDKMAQKRALVAAALSLGFSEQFTQDMEDIGNGAHQSAPTPQHSQAGLEDNQWRGVLTNVTAKQGITRGKPWTLYNVTGDDDSSFGTFDEKVADIARSHVEAREMVTVTWETTKKGNKNILIIDTEMPGE